MKIIIDLNDEKVRSEMLTAYLEYKKINIEKSKYVSLFREDDETGKRYYNAFIVNIK